MKMRSFKGIYLGFCLIFVLFLFSTFGQEKVDYAKIVGSWDIEVDAGGEYYYLTLVLKEADGELSGTISESSGFFTDVGLTKIEYDGSNLSFDFIAPTPPDGAERIIQTEFEVGKDEMEGSMTISDLGMTVGCVATREKK